MWHAQLLLQAANQMQTLEQQLLQKAPETTSCIRSNKKNGKVLRFSKSKATYRLVVSWVEPVPTFIKTSSIVVRDKPKLEKPKLLLCAVYRNVV